MVLVASLNMVTISCVEWLGSMLDSKNAFDLEKEQLVLLFDDADDAAVVFVAAAVFAIECFDFLLVVVSVLHQEANGSADDAIFFSSSQHAEHL